MDGFLLVDFEDEEGKKEALRKLNAHDRDLMRCLREAGGYDREDALKITRILKGRRSYWMQYKLWEAGQQAEMKLEAELDKMVAPDDTWNLEDL